MSDSKSPSESPAPPTDLFAKLAIQCDPDLAVGRTTLKDKIEKYEAWKSVFTEPTLEVAKVLPSVDPMALLQFVESPVVLYLFRQFVVEAFNVKPGTSNGGGLWITEEQMKTVYGSFENLSFKIRDTLPLAPPMFQTIYPIKYRGRAVEDAIKEFMEGCARWADSEVGLLIKPYFKIREVQIQILLGILGICLRLEQLGQFPHDILKWKIKGPTQTEGNDHWGIKSSLVPFFQAWRLRFSSNIRDDGFILYWSCKMEDEKTIEREEVGGWRWQCYLNEIKGSRYSYHADLERKKRGI
ncbi:hypothetical protein F4778DRAFT_763973 [Xylariomycetidae sp. FL2044]|nr:hypothetical protein F4778DRAFT_763973 [Xylariomycetidae sp. FL2044]